MIIDAAQKIHWINEAFTNITGFGPEEVLGKEPGDLLYGKDTAPATIEYIIEKMQQMQPFDCEIINYSKTGTKYWMHMQGQALFGEPGYCDQYFTTQIDITEKVLLEQKLTQEREGRLQEITAAILTAQENERTEIGKELHDNVNQILGATKLYIEMARALKYNRDIYLEKSCGYIVNVIEEIRKISKTMTPQGMDIIGLAESIKILLCDLRLILPSNTLFTEDGMDEIDVDPTLKLNIFRIVQEQLNNILKHAAASSIKIHLSRQAENIVLVMADNGKGCNPHEKRKGVGITNIISRANLHNGVVSVVSSPGNGYQLTVLFALHELIPVKIKG
jgi:PAS domain S-box-containing protein